MVDNQDYSLGITTKIDKLLDALLTKKKMDAKSLAKELNEKEETILEWSKTLEKEGLIEVEYVLTKPYLKLAKGAEQKILSKRKKRIDSVAQDLLYKAENAANQAVIASEQLNQLEQIIRKLDLIYKTDESKVAEVEKRLDEIKKKSDKYQKDIFEILTQLNGRAEDVYLKIEQNTHEINELLQKIQKDFNIDRFNQVKNELKTLLEEASYIKENTDQLSKDLQKYIELKDFIMKHKEELQKVKEFFNEEKFAYLEQTLIDASKIIENYYSIRNDLKKYSQFLNISISDVDKKILELQNISNELLDAYKKASALLNIDENNLSDSNIHELNEKVNLLKQEINGMKDLADEILEWLSSTDIKLTIQEYERAVHEKEKYSEKLKDYLSHLSEIKPEITRLMDEIKLYKVELINEIRDASTEVNDLKVDLEEFKKNLNEWKKNEQEYISIKQKISELIALKEEMLKTVDKIQKEISILSIQFNSLKESHELEDVEGNETESEINQIISNDESLKEEVRENKVESSLESNVIKVNQMSESYLKKKQIIEEMLKKIWEKEYGSSAVASANNRKK
ncbi:MAG: hypothetical protein QXF76_03340 [Candidatus Anstonellales archaeon]